IYGGIEHLAWNAVNRRGSLDVARTADALTDLILRGVGAAPEQEPGTTARLAAQLDRLERVLRRREAWWRSASSRTTRSARSSSRRRAPSPRPTSTPSPR